MKVGILIAGDTPVQLSGKFPSFAQMMEQMFPVRLPQASFTHFNVKDDEFPDDVLSMDAWIITGSVRSANDELPWMLKLERFIQEVASKRVRMIGICFGHQLIAKALGGTVEKHPQGWGVGLHEYHWQNEPETQCVRLPAFHQDQVTQAPASAKRVMTSSFCKNAALVYDDVIFTCQFHPEFSKDFEQALLALFSDIIPTPTVDAANQSLVNHPSDNDVVVDWIGKFLEK
ncbi:hypothetical protein [Vibrio sp. 10N.261.55.A7]|uniref:type 1 glutamine amidotransferase n=1 Tax=Vibrio sp. 10N.261.55.A7 TaxID=1880851 RepID=UPI000C838998|nr:hypothetical protein [Vibrio sp. 10N.261.55.A7]PMJ98134.1 hypothetical protein BCU12_04320 [Vibrio sp. 10N.261.55.A7]